jgi:calmodulin-lysine N-methyltransferase
MTNKEIQNMDSDHSARPSSLRWQILRRALLRRSPLHLDDQSESSIRNISRKAGHGFELILYQLRDSESEESSDSLSKSVGSRDACVCYTLPISNSPRVFVHQRETDHTDLNDFEVCNKYNIDNTGLVCNWPSEEVLAYYCLSHSDMFRDKRVIELGAGYGLAGLVISVLSEALEVVISDGNPQVVNYIQRNISANSASFGDTKVESSMLHWDHQHVSHLSNSFDIIIASDCTFFKEFHKGLAQTVKLLLKNSNSQALFFSPKRGDSLDKFLAEVKEFGLRSSVDEVYNTQIWTRHQELIDGENKSSWPNYEKDHCYPLLVRITM